MAGVGLTVCVFFSFSFSVINKNVCSQGHHMYDCSGDDGKLVICGCIYIYIYRLGISAITGGPLLYPACIP